MARSSIYSDQPEPSDIIPVNWNGKVMDHGSVRSRGGIKEKLDAFLLHLYTVRGVKFTRNEFILKAIRFYLDHLLQSSTTKEVQHKIESQPIE